MQRIGCFAFGILLACGDSASDGGTGAGGEGGDPTGGTTTSTSVTSAATTSSSTSATTTASTGSTGGGGAGGGCGLEVVAGGTTADPGTPGVPQLLATDIQQIWGVTVGPGHVFWTSGTGPGRLARVPKDGGDVEALATDLVDPYEPRFDDGYVYFGDADGTVKRVNADGGCVEVVVSGQDLPVALAFDSTSLYFADFTTGQIGRAPKAGGAVEMLATGQDNPGEVIVWDGYVYWVNRAGNTVDGGTLARVSTAGGAVETVVTQLTVPVELSVFQDTVFFGTADGGNDTTSWRTFDPATSQSSVLLADAGNFTDVVVDGDSLLYGHVVPNLLRSFTPGQAVTDVVSVPERPFYLGQDATHVFWSHIDVGEVMRLAKP